MNSIEEDFFDRLSDPLLLLIFNKLGDAKSLIRCLSVSKRFASLISETDNVFLPLPSRKCISKSKPRNLFKILVDKLIAKPFHFLHHMIGPKSDTGSNQISYYSPNEVLKHFKQVRSLQIELPSNGSDTGLSVNGEHSLLKWKAEFGGQLKCCVILGATSFQRNNEPLSDNLVKEHKLQQEQHDSGGVLTDDELKLRIIWTISCLIAASGRHCLLKQIIAQHSSLEEVAISDGNKQGRLCVTGKEQVVEMRNSLNTLEASMERSQVGDLSLKLWYAPLLQLPESGYLMKGATLIVIKPAGMKIETKGSSVSELLGSFDAEENKAFDEAAREMVKLKKNYVMTMNSF